MRPCAVHARFTLFLACLHLAGLERPNGCCVRIACPCAFVAPSAAMGLQFTVGLPSLMAVVHARLVGLKCPEAMACAAGELRAAA
eukprot:3545055-Alexandrium_andersonii.AAC.1